VWTGRGQLVRTPGGGAEIHTGEGKKKVSSCGRNANVRGGEGVSALILGGWGGGGGGGDAPAGRQHQPKFESKFL